MEPKTNYTIVGLTVLLLIIGLIVTAIWLSVGFDRKKYHFYTIYVREAVSGLNEDSVVKYNGVRVGVVESIALSQVDPQKTRIVIKIEDGTPITMSTRATLMTQGITGATYLGLAANSSTFIPLQKTPGEPYPVIPAKPSFLNQLESDINAISFAFQKALSPENTENFKESLANIQKISEVIAQNGESIAQGLQDFPAVVEELKNGILKFNAMAVNMAKAGKQVTVTMEAGKTGLDKISQQTIPPVILLLRRLDLIAADLEKVSAQMRQNPAVIIRGNTPPRSGPGE